MAYTPQILIVDDATHIATTVSDRLIAAGFRVRCAHDAASALRDSISHKPDLIITDCQQHPQDSQTLAHSLLQHPATQDIPVIVLAARTHPIDQKGETPANIKAVIGKPFNPHPLLGEIYKLLDIAHLTQVAVAS